MSDERFTYRVAIITASDTAYTGGREDLSGKAVRDMVQEHGYTVKSYLVLPDERRMLREELRRLCDEQRADLILTTGGTGLSPRDVTPEATLDIAQRQAPGIAEAMRMNSLAVTGRAMLSRGVAATRGRTLIINLPGSPKAVRENLSYVLPQLDHALDILTGRDSECGAQIND
ncbi:MogA/MoaB family molybdenum cofactor biosynthesis protein [Agathobaculum sp.]|uniref:MogA/MoaB family molybdenum cofactor biosynthesis protein n=1 Tax=Agathobaculum sp. TaxID=2048138 RepID=UPI002A83CB83|nr:MogA/MoaB family molybdenum cofactor biosynthesis protein [Agathobaculum sp.]MDY3618706.1 MogA/MoaB family molybdenum cofactor biosynthesis protein [Agathobaculum sp.]